MSLTIKELCVDLQKTRILKNINLEIRTGEFVSLLGASGCGKTTLLKSIAGLLETQEGDIRIDDTSITNLAPEKKRNRDCFSGSQTVSAYDGRTEYQLFDGSEKNPEKR
ncbi:MAG: ATP-binding cassette domain-containing protein [Coprococcus comes]